MLNVPGIQYGPDKFAYNTNEIGPVVIPDFAFHNFSGIISNTSLGVFPNTTFGTQAAFLQSYTDSNGTFGSEIDWTVTGLNLGEKYVFSFQDVSAQVVPGESFTVTAGASSNFYIPGAAYAPQSLSFVATGNTMTIQLVGTTQAGNWATALDNFTVSSVPEPAAWMFMLAGLAGMGGLLRARRTLTPVI